MPLFRHFEFGALGELLIWKIEESEPELMTQVKLHPEEQRRLDLISHPDKRLEFLALRRCLSVYFGTNPEVRYEAGGKPYLTNEYHISFSHSRGMAGVMLSKTAQVGLDLENDRRSILRVAERFMRDDEARTLSKENTLGHLSYYWGAKEAMLKVIGDKKLDFKRELRVSPFFFQSFDLGAGNVVTRDYFRPMQLIFKQDGQLYISIAWDRLSEIKGHQVSKA